MKTRLTVKLIEQCFGKGTRINSRFPFAGYKIRTRTGGSLIATENGFKDAKGGADVWEGLAKLGKTLGWEGVKVSGPIESLAHLMLSGQRHGIEVEAGETRKFFGLIKKEPPALPLPSGVHGSQGLDWTDAQLGTCGLLGAPYGEGVRCGASLESGSALRYAGEDAENSIIGFGPPGTGKGVCFQAPACLEFTGSQVLIDPSGQLTSICMPEWLRRGWRVLPIMPFTEGFPPSLTALVQQSRCLNAMDILNPNGQSFPGDCIQLGQLLKPEATVTGGDPFFPLSGRNLIALLIACVKLYAHPAQQNLSEVYHTLGNVFNFARAIMARSNVPRFIRTPLRRLTAPAAEFDKTLRSIVETALAELSWLGDSAIERIGRTSSFNWDDLKNGPRPVVVPVLLPVNKLESHKPLLTLLTGAGLMGLGASERGRHQVLFTVDEAALLKYMPMLAERGFAESRKRGVTLSVWFQNIHQAEAIYGNAWKNMLSGADVQVFLRPRDLASAEFIADQIGTKTEILPHFGYAPEPNGNARESVSFSEQGRPVLFPADIMNLPRWHAIMLAPGRSKNALKIWARPWFDCPDLKAKGGSDPYHNHRSKKG